MRRQEDEPSGKDREWESRRGKVFRVPATVSGVSSSPWDVDYRGREVVDIPWGSPEVSPLPFDSDTDRRRAGHAKVLRDFLDLHDLPPRRCDATHDSRHRRGHFTTIPLLQDSGPLFMSDAVLPRYDLDHQALEAGVLSPAMSTRKPLV